MGLQGFIDLISNATSTGVCTNCCIIETVAESRCYREIEQVVATMEAEA